MTSTSPLSKVDVKATVFCGEQPTRLFSFLSDLYLCESPSISQPEPPNSHPSVHLLVGIYLPRPDFLLFLRLEIGDRWPRSFPPLYPVSHPARNSFGSSLPDQQTGTHHIASDFSRRAGGVPLPRSAAPNVAREHREHFRVRVGSGRLVGS